VHKLAHLERMCNPSETDGQSKSQMVRPVNATNCAGCPSVSVLTLLRILSVWTARTAQTVIFGILPCFSPAALSFWLGAVSFSFYFVGSLPIELLNLGSTWLRSERSLERFPRAFGCFTCRGFGAVFTFITPLPALSRLGHTHILC